MHIGQNSQPVRSTEGDVKGGSREYQVSLITVVEVDWMRKYICEANDTSAAKQRIKHQLASGCYSSSSLSSLQAR